jgi:hypothetical protein
VAIEPIYSLQATSAAQGISFGNAMGELEDGERRLGHHVHLAMADLQRKGRSERCRAGNGGSEKLSMAQSSIAL